MIEWGELRTIHGNLTELRDGEVMWLTVTGLPHRCVQRVGDHYRHGRRK